MRLHIHFSHKRKFAFAKTIKIPVRVAAHNQENFFCLRNRQPGIDKIITPLPPAFQNSLCMQWFQCTPHGPQRRRIRLTHVLDWRERTINRNLSRLPVLQQQSLYAFRFEFMRRHLDFWLCPPKVAVAVFCINLPLRGQFLVSTENGERRRPRRRRHLAHGREPVPILIANRFNPLAKIFDCHGEPQYNTRYTITRTYKNFSYREHLVT